MLKVGTRVIIYNLGGHHYSPTGNYVELKPLNRSGVISCEINDMYSCTLDEPLKSGHSRVFVHKIQVVPLRIANTEIYKALTEET